MFGFGKSPWEMTPEELAERERRSAENLAQMLADIEAQKKAGRCPDRFVSRYSNSNFGGGF